MRPLPLSLPAAVFPCLAGSARPLLDRNADQIDAVRQSRFGVAPLGFTSA